MIRLIYEGVWRYFSLFEANFQIKKLNVTSNGPKIFLKLSQNIFNNFLQKNGKLKITI